MIKLDHVTKVFGKQNTALSDITTTIVDGEFVFLIGPSGAGKTTLLRMLLRDHMPSTGDIFIDEWHLNDLPQSKIHQLRRKVGMVFQDFKLLSDRTVYENIALGLEILGKTDIEIQKGVADVLHLVGLSEKKKLFPAQLSAGERQRVSIARAIVGGPKILLADEPTGNLDPETGWEIMELLLEINKLGTTVIVATHNVAFVNHLKKRTITIEKGAIKRDEMKGKYHLSDKQKNPEEIHDATKEDAV